MKIKAILIFFLLPFFASAQTGSQPFPAIILNMDNGRKVELAGIIIPQEVVSEANEIISRFKNAESLQYGKTKINRHGNHLAHVYKGKEWLQGELLKKGLALAYPSVDNDLYIKEMYEVESSARKAGLGIWNLPEFVVVNADMKSELLKNRGSFRIVEGRVFEVKEKSDKIYINFERDWKTDFTVMIRKENKKKFSDLESLAGKAVMVRGWLESYNGPLMEVFNGGQLVVR